VARRAQRDPRRQRAVALLDQEVPTGAEHARRAAEEAVGIRDVMDHVVRDEDVHACVGVRQLLRIDDAHGPRSRFRVGELERARAEEELAEARAAADLDRVRLRSEVVLHPREALLKQELQVRSRALLVLITRALRVPRITNE
jgi:hypothetical protein